MQQYLLACGLKNTLQLIAFKINVNYLHLISIHMQLSAQNIRQTYKSLVQVKHIYLVQQQLKCSTVEHKIFCNLREPLAIPYVYDFLSQDEHKERFLGKQKIF